MKYMLIEVAERAIGAPKIFDSYEDAHQEMRERFAEVCGVPVSEVEAYLQANYGPDEEFDHDANINGGAAWTEQHGENYDWQIFQICGDVCRIVYENQEGDNVGGNKILRSICHIPES